MLLRYSPTFPRRLHHEWGTLHTCASCCFLPW